PYYFSDDNCSSQILELIEVAEPRAQLTNHFHDFVIPLDTVKVLNQEGLLSKEQVRTSLQTEWRTRYGNLNLSQRSALKEVLQNKAADSDKYAQLPKKKKAEALEAAMSYLAIKEYRDHKEYKSEKYDLAVARARLGSLTDPVEIVLPKSPLLSPPTTAFYLGYGQIDEVDFYQFKFRRGFHDLLSDDSGLAPFSQLNFFSFDLRYHPTLQNWDLYEFVLLSILSTSPWTQLEKPMTWMIDIGTSPKFLPYVNGGIGTSFDLPLAQATRWSWLAVSKNTDLTEIAKPYLGVETLFMTKWTEHFRSVIKADYLYSTNEGRSLGIGGLAMAYDHGKIEYRLEAERRDTENRWMLSVVF
ncbi:MAG: DUF4105 domain-containing protein, partial [Bdellovibrio sp.]|nr:DUF4105 domain-containing protein [Bdellovibrio sp.]